MLNQLHGEVVLDGYISFLVWFPVHLNETWPFKHNFDALFIYLSIPCIPCHIILVSLHLVLTAKSWRKTSGTACVMKTPFPLETVHVDSVMIMSRFSPVIPQMGLGAASNEGLLKLSGNGSWTRWRQVIIWHKRTPGYTWASTFIIRMWCLRQQFGQHLLSRDHGQSPGFKYSARGSQKGLFFSIIHEFIATAAQTPREMNQAGQRAQNTNNITITYSLTLSSILWNPASPWVQMHNYLIFDVITARQGKLCE